MRNPRLAKFVDSRGWSLNDVYSMFNPKLEDANNYQINYSILYPGIIKAWHRHKYQDDYFCILKGMAQVGVYTDKNGPESFTSVNITRQSFILELESGTVLLR